MTKKQEDNVKENNTTQEQTKTINPSEDLGNYLIQIVGDDGESILKRLIVNNCTVNLQALGNSSTCAEIK